MEAEHEEEEGQADTESDDDEQQIYNPLKLPMGWGGKPIPYWLYKLHGLGQEFKCEICRNHSYWCRRAYEHHFKEFRHQHGMRCLGIPNTKNFNEITSIEEAKQLWGRIQEQRMKKWRAELEEEFEDRGQHLQQEDLHRSPKAGSNLNSLTRPIVIFTKTGLYFCSSSSSRRELLFYVCS